MSASPVEDYLDDLFVELRRSAPHDARMLLAEAEGHLRDAVDSARAEGLNPLEAERAAVRRFGAAHRVAREDRSRRPFDMVRRIAVSGWLLGSVGAIAVGVSGVIVGAMHLAGASNEFIAGGRSTSTFPATDCARWLAQSPRAASCAQAALDDWTGEVIGYRIALGLLGVLALALWVIARRRWRGANSWAPLPPTVLDTIATTLFALSGVWLAGLGVDAMVTNSGHGAGGWLSAAPVALVAAAVFGVRLVRDICTDPVVIS